MVTCSSARVPDGTRVRRVRLSNTSLALDRGRLSDLRPRRKPPRPPRRPVVRSWPGIPAWTGTGTASAATSTSTATTVNGQKIGFRWRLGADSGIAGSTYGGFAIDDVVIGRLSGTSSVSRHGTRVSSAGSARSTRTDPGATTSTSCTITDVCSAGSCVGTSWPWHRRRTQNPEGFAAGKAIAQLHDASPVLCNVQTGRVRGDLKLDARWTRWRRRSTKACKSLISPDLTSIDGTAPATPGTRLLVLGAGSQNACGKRGTYRVPGCQRRAARRATTPVRRSRASQSRSGAG